MVEFLSGVVVYISYLSAFSPLLPLCLILRRRRLLGKRVFILLLGLLITSLVSDLVCYVLAKSHISTMSVVNVYFIVEFLILSALYAYLLADVKKYIYTIAIACASFFVINSIYVQGVEVVQSYTATLCSVITIGYCLILFHDLIGNLPSFFISRNYLFWLNTGVVYYYSFNLLLFIFSTYVFLNLSRQEVMAVWLFHNLNNIIKHILFSIAIYRGVKAVVNTQPSTSNCTRTWKQCCHSLNLCFRICLNIRACFRMRRKKRSKLEGEYNRLLAQISARRKMISCLKKIFR